jgi:hypothetical protein
MRSQRRPSSSFIRFDMRSGGEFASITDFAVRESLTSNITVTPSAASTWQMSRCCPAAECLLIDHVAPEAVGTQVRFPYFAVTQSPI